MFRERIYFWSIAVATMIVFSSVVAVLYLAGVYPVVVVLVAQLLGLLEGHVLWKVDQMLKERRRGR